MLCVWGKRHSEHGRCFRAVIPLQRWPHFRIGALLPSLRMAFSPQRGPQFWVRVRPRRCPLTPFPSSAFCCC
eukprot:7981278-Pyramimonas_sp.AAC.1